MRTTAFVVAPLLHDTRSPEWISRNHVAISSKNRPGTAPEPARHRDGIIKTRRRFRRRFRVRHHPGTWAIEQALLAYLGHANEPPLPCSGHGPAPLDGLLLAAHSHTTAFESPGRPSANQSRDRAPDTTPAAAVLPGLVMIFVLSVTLLEGVTPRVIVVCPRLPPGHSLPGRSGAYRRNVRAFSRSKREAPAYPRTMILRDSAPSPIELTSKGLRPFHG